MAAFYFEKPETVISQP